MRFLSNQKLLTITALALLGAACAEFAEEAGEAGNTLADENATWEQAGDELSEAAKSIAPGEQKEGDIELKIDALDNALQDLETALDDLDEPDPKLDAELDELKKVAAEARLELERLGDDATDAANTLGQKVEDAFHKADQRIRELTDAD